MPVSIHYAKHVLMAVLIAGPRLEMKRTARKQIRIFLTKIAAIDVVALWASKDGKARCTFLANIFKYHSNMVRFKMEHQEIKARNGGAVPSTALAATTAATLAAVDLFVVPQRVAAGLRLDEDAVRASDAKADAREETGFLTGPCELRYQGAGAGGRPSLQRAVPRLKKIDEPRTRPRSAQCPPNTKI